MFVLYWVLEHRICLIDVVYLQNETDDHEATVEEEGSVEEITEEVYINIMISIVLPV